MACCATFLLGGVHSLLTLRALLLELINLLIN